MRARVAPVRKAEHTILLSLALLKSASDTKFDNRKQGISIKWFH